MLYRPDRPARPDHRPMNDTDTQVALCGFHMLYWLIADAVCGSRIFCSLQGIGTDDCDDLEV
jgi:hypothetical protein